VTREEWAALGTQLLAAWGHASPPPGWSDACYALVAGYPVEVVIKAAHQHAVEDKPGFLPSMGRVAHLAARLLGTGPPDFDQVWEEVQAAVRREGAYARSLDELGLSAPARRLVEAFGWQDWCAAANLDNLRAQARRMYEAQADRAITTAHREQLRAGAPRHVAELLPGAERRPSLPGDDDRLRRYDAINAAAASADACPFCGQLDTGGAPCAECAAHGVG
jgi:hypothetical protein